jgi:hypothetical protein
VRREDLAAVEDAARRQAGFRSITSAALEAAATGQTSVAEVISQLAGLDERGGGPIESSDLAPDQVDKILSV